MVELELLMNADYWAKGWEKAPNSRRRLRSEEEMVENWNPPGRFLCPAYDGRKWSQKAAGSADHAKTGRCASSGHSRGER